MSSINKKILEKLESKTKIYLTIILLLLVLICTYNKKMIIPAIVVYLLIIAYTIFVNKKRKGIISKQIEELTLNVDSAAKNTLINSPFPLIIVKSNGDIIWRSSRFTKEFAEIDINTHLEKLVKDIKANINNNNISSIDEQIVMGKKSYNVLGGYVKSKDKKQETQYLMTLYFIDVTVEKELLQQYENDKTCMSIIMIDNYEEMMQRISTEEKTQVLANIEKSLYNWATKTGGVMIKTDRDVFVYVFEKQYLEIIENDTFDILGTIKQIELENVLQLSLSIAVSVEGETNYEKYKSALAAMDLALGRGGDQIVIRKNGQYSFFGGRSQEVEKRTKVKARIISHALEELILEAENVMIMGHVNGDIDSMGASLGIYRFARTFGKEAYIVNDTDGITLSKFMENLNKEEYSQAILNSNESLNLINSKTLLIIVDTHKKTYVEAPDLLEKTEKIVIIDHHRKSTDFIEGILNFHEVYASSASELVTEIIQYSEKNIELQKIEAESLYAGIMMDTKNFTFKTGVRTFEAAAYLKKYGIDIIKVKKWFQSNLKNYNIIAEIVKNTEIMNNTIGISVYNQVDKDSNLICAKAADELLTISDITASFVIGKLGEKICISGRSIGDINVQVILEKLRRWRSYYTCRSSN